MNNKLHVDYGLAYPLTYQINFPSGNSNLQVLYKERENDAWLELEEQTSEDFFNGINAVRFD